MIDQEIKLTLPNRLRRNRKSESIRTLVRETDLKKSNLIQPFFLIDGYQKKEVIKEMPGIYRFSADLLLKKAEDLFEKGMKAIALFPVIDPSQKTVVGKEALNSSGFLAQTIALLKKEIPELTLIVDVALDPYTSHGHDGVINDQGEILNDETVGILGEMAIMLAEAGTDIVAPSDMMDGRVGYIRKVLDESNFQNTSILSYSVKYASSLYAPFREALGTYHLFADKRSYHMDPANRREALLEAELDMEEGADILMVKPATLYLDIISQIRNICHKPIAAYHVSGEYSMVMAADEKGYLNADKVFYEALLSIKRAGADMILTYAGERMLSNGLLVS